MFGRHFFLFLAFLVFYVFTRKQSREFKNVFDHLKDGDKNETSIAHIKAMKEADATKAPKRNLRAMYIDLDEMFQRHQVPEDVKMMMDDMRFAGHEIMSNMTDEMDRMF